MDTNQLVGGFTRCLTTIAERCNLGTVASIDVFHGVRSFLEKEVLKGEGNVEPSTPLLEWGLLDSLNTVELVAYMEKRFDVTVPATAVTGENFRDLASICGMLSRLLDEQAVRAGSVRRS
jgi:acyl carrier protein